MNLPVMIGEVRPPPPKCPDCGRLMVYHSNLHRYQCHPCAIDERERTEAEETVPLPWPLPWWLWVLLALILLFCLALAIYGFPEGGGGMSNLTQSEAQERAQDALAWVIVVGFIGCIVALIMEMKRERCPACGECLRLVSEVDKYKCMHCGAWYPREDIEVEGYE